MAWLSADFRAGARDVAPTLPAILSFGLVVGAAALDVGLTVGQALGLSVVVFAGASQLAIIGLLAAGAPLAVVVLTALVINLRMVMYSAGLAPYLRGAAARWRAPVAYLLVDHAYVLAVLQFDADESVDRPRYFLGLGVPTWVAWVAGTAAGALLGTALPAWVPFDFAVPMVFLALLVPAVTDRATAGAAGAGGVVAVLGAGLPLNLGLLAGALVGVATGIALSRGSAA